MRDVISVYRGYSIFLSLGLNWSFTATPRTPDRPILPRAEWKLPLAENSTRNREARN